MNKIVLGVLVFGVIGPLFLVGMYTGWNIYTLGNAFVAVVCSAWIGMHRHTAAYPNNRK